MREAPAARGRGLEAAVAPAGVEVEPGDGRSIDDRRAVQAHVHHAAPHAQNARAADHRHQRHAAFADVLDGREIAALGVGIVAVDIAAEDEAALVRLADVEMPGAEGDDAGDDRLQGFGDERLQYVRFDRQIDAGFRCQKRRMASDGEADLFGVDRAARRLHAGDGAGCVAQKACNLAILDDVDAQRGSGAGVTPDDGVVARRAAAPLQEAALNWEARIVEIQERRHAAHIVGVEQFGIDAVESHRVATPGVSVALCVGVEEVHDPALADHRVVVEVLLQPLPQFHRVFVERDVAVEAVIGADDRRVAPGVSAADPAFFDDGDIRQAVVLGEVIGGGEAMAAAADDYDVVAGLGRCVAPSGPPIPVAAERVARERENRIIAH